LGLIEEHLGLIESARIRCLSELRQHTKKEVAARRALERCCSPTTDPRRMPVSPTPIFGIGNAECWSGIHRVYGETMLKLVSMKDLQYSDPRLVLTAVA
jgi:hypothetical protein